MNLEDGELWQQRYKVEQILEVRCPECGAKPHQWCDRSGDKLSRRGRALERAGTPPSHQQRMWLRQGHAEHEFPALLARQRPGWDETGRLPAGGSYDGVMARQGCGPCEAERKVRAKLNSPAFPLDFPCRHPRPASWPVPPLPARYRGERVCPRCKALRDVEVAVQDPAVIGYRCGQCSHMWLAAAGQQAA